MTSADHDNRDDKMVKAAFETLRSSYTHKPNGAGKQYPYQLVQFDELRPGRKSSFLVSGVIPATGIVAVWGPPKCGKSFWAFDLTMHIALAWPYRGRRVNGGPVAYLAFEGAAGFGARAEAFRRQHLNNRPFAIGHAVQVEVNGVFVFEKPTRIREIHEHEGETWYIVFGSDSAVPMSSLRRATSPIPFFLLASNAKLVRDHKALIESIDGQIDAPPVCVVLDTLNRSIDGSESKDQDMGDYLAAAEAIVQEFDCVVVIVHHCGVDGSRPRGHTSLTGAADAQLSVKRDRAENVIVQVEYMKDGPEGTTFTSALKTLDVGTDDEGQPITSCAIVPVEGAAAAARGPKLTGAVKLAFDQLVDVLASGSERAPASNYIPTGARVCSIQIWREQFYNTHPGEKQGTKQKAFVRAFLRLQELRLVGAWKDWVWLAIKSS